MRKNHESVIHRKLDYFVKATRAKGYYMEPHRRKANGMDTIQETDQTQQLRSPGKTWGECNLFLKGRERLKEK
jgi:hypothetical protein